jgi:hypothetical protein
MYLVKSFLCTVNVNKYKFYLFFYFVHTENYVLAANYVLKLHVVNGFFSFILEI